MSIKDPEYLEIYNVHGRPTGRLFQRSQFHLLREDEFMLCVHIYITDGGGRWLLQKRSASKSFLPGVWDITAGAVDPGENCLQAAVRELREELGIAVSPQELRFHSCMTKGQGLIEFWSLERPLNLKELTLQPDEVDQVDWFSREEAINLISLAEGGGEYIALAAELMASYR